jgi:hypothetical protein
MRVSSANALGIICCLAAAPMFASPIALDTTLTPVSGTGSPGSGTFTSTFDPTTNVLAFVLTWTDLTTNLTNAHIHLAATPGGNGGVLVPFFAAGTVETITPTPPALPLGTAGSLTESIQITDPVTLASFLSGSAGGLLYVNVHSVNFPGGEIRGNLPATTLTPEPASLGLTLAALAGLMALGAHKRRRSATM